MVFKDLVSITGFDHDCGIVTHKPHLDPHREFPPSSRPLPGPCIPDLQLWTMWNARSTTAVKDT